MTPLRPHPPQDFDETLPDHNRVGIRRRALALAVDVTGILLLSFLFGPWIGIRLGLGVYAGQGPGAGGMMAGAAAGTALIGLTWFGTEAIWGATPGKRALGLQIGTDDGRVAERSRIVLRWALKNAPTLFGFLSVVVSLGAPRVGQMVELLSNLSGLVVVAGCVLAIGSHHQALHDMLAKTAVYRRTELVPPADS